MHDTHAYHHHHHHYHHDMTWHSCVCYRHTLIFYLGFISRGTTHLKSFPGHATWSAKKPTMVHMRKDCKDEYFQGSHDKSCASPFDAVLGNTNINNISSKETSVPLLHGE
jgi:hypothetical protein